MSNSRISSGNTPSLLEQEMALAAEMQAAAKLKAKQLGMSGPTEGTPHSLKARRESRLQRLREQLASGAIPTGTFIDMTDPVPEPEFTPEQMQKIDREISAVIEKEQEDAPKAGAPPELICGVCGFEAKSKAGLGAHKRRHR